MNEELLEKAIIGDRKNIFQEVLDAAYSLEKVSRERIVEIAKRTNKKLGFELFTTLEYETLIHDFSIVVRMMQINSFLDRKEIPSLYEKAEYEYLNGASDQEKLYDSLVVETAIDNPSLLSTATEEYRESLNGLDIVIFRKLVKYIINVIKKEDVAKYESFKERFTAIGRYIQFRSEFDKKIAEILAGEGDSRTKNELADSIDRKRSVEHNKVISLFNDLNELADKLNYRRPYLYYKKTFDKGIKADREAVAMILHKQEPLIDRVNFIIRKKRKL